MKRLSVWFLVVLLTGCSTAYYGAMEKLGFEKRDILVDRVEKANESQVEAQQQFQSALEQLSALIDFDGGQLQDVYTNVNDEYEASKSAADEVSQRINKIEDVAEDLFAEWQDELEQYSSAKLKRDSERKLKETERNYRRLIRAMRLTEAKMQPVLAALKDNVLYLKHNLNAQAVGTLKGEFSQIKGDIRSLIADMNQTIEESSAFIASLEGNSR